MKTINWRQKKNTQRQEETKSTNQVMVSSLFDIISISKLFHNNLNGFALFLNMIGNDTKLYENVTNLNIKEEVAETNKSSISNIEMECDDESQMEKPKKPVSAYLLYVRDVFH